MKLFMTKVFEVLWFLCSCSLFSDGTFVGRDAEAEAEAGSGPFSVKAEAPKFHRFRFHIGGKNGGRKGIGSAILRRRANRGEHKH